MRTIAFEPGLPPAQAEAVQTVKAMQIANAVLIPRRRFWEEDGLGLSMLSDGPAGMVLAQAYDPDPNQINAFLVFARGPWAQFLDRRGPEAAKALILADIERARPAARGALDVVHYWSWSAYPHTAGAFSVFGPGQVSRLARAMAAPVGRITFAGEQNAALNRGLEGALEAGERGALELLDLL
jgi:monoamine oxidase